MIQQKTQTLKTTPPPHFIILGVQKGGTNSLYHYLCQHPQIVPAVGKEIHFFTLNYDKGFEWYQRQFPASADGQQLLTGEGTPYYLFHPWVPSRLYQAFPQVKLIVLLRNPVDRVISHYFWEKKLGYETLSLEEAIASEPQRLQGELEKLHNDGTYYSFNHQHYTYLSRSLYVEQLQTWMRFFPREQFLILKSEDLYNHPSSALKQVFDFLGLPDYQLPNYEIYNANSYPTISAKIRQSLIEYFQPYNQHLTEILGQHFTWDQGQPQHQRLAPKMIELKPSLMLENPSSSPNQPLKNQLSSTIMNQNPQTPEPAKIDYEGAWDEYAKNWSRLNTEQVYIGDEWIGVAAGAANSLAEYESLIEQKFIAPYIHKHHSVLEIGIGGGRTAALLLKYCDRLICADISNTMLQATRERLGEERISYVKLDGLTLDGIAPASMDVCFCYDTMVHIEPRDIFNYLSRIPPLLKGDRLCLFHHTNILSQLGWQKFLHDWDKNLLGRRHGTAFSIMTDTIMEKFLTHLNYKIIHKDTESVPRDCVWICQAPAL